MIISNSTLGAEVVSLPSTVKVWDPFVRIFHWSLVALFAVAFVTGDEVARLHIWAGYAIAALVALRFIWGVFGPRYARFATFVTGPSGVLTYLKQSTRLEAPRHLGHHPAGGAMILALLLLLVGVSVTGFALTTAAFSRSEFMEDIHEVLANITLALVVLHVLGVIVASLAHGENLVSAMITGRKRAD